MQVYTILIFVGSFSLFNGVYCPVWSVSVSVLYACSHAHCAAPMSEKSDCPPACRWWRARHSCSAYWGRACSHRPPLTHYLLGSFETHSLEMPRIHAGPRGHSVWISASAGYQFHWTHFSLVAPERRDTPGWSHSLLPQPAGRGWRAGCPCCHLDRYDAAAGRAPGTGHRVGAPGNGAAEAGHPPEGTGCGQQEGETWRGWHWGMWSGR